MSKPMSAEEQRWLRKLERLRIERERLILRLREVKAELAATEAARPGRARHDEATR